MRNAIVIASSIFIIGIIKMLFRDKYTVAFASIPLTFIILINAANAIHLRVYNRKLLLLLRDDSLKGKSFFEVAGSIFVIGLPLVIPILYIWALRHFQ